MEYHIKTSQALEHLRTLSAEQSAVLLELGSLTVRFLRATRGRPATAAHAR